MVRLNLPQEELPVLGEVDVAVIGGSSPGLASAVRFADSGMRVMVIESRTYLGWEWTAALRPWFEKERNGPLPQWLQVLIEELKQENGEGKDGRIHFLPDQLKLRLEDMLADRGIELIYASLPVEVSFGDPQYRGLVIANKSGRQVIRCKEIVDASETALLSALLGDSQPSFAAGEEAIYWRTLSFQGVTDPEEARSSAQDEAPAVTDTSIDVPEAIGIYANRVKVLKGKDRVYVHYGLILPSQNTPDVYQAREQKAQQQGIGLAEYLVKHEPGYQEAKLTSASYELYGPFAEGQKNSNLTPDWKSIQCHPHGWSISRDVYGNGNTAWLRPTTAAAFADEMAKGIADGSLNPATADASHASSARTKEENRSGAELVRPRTEGAEQRSDASLQPSTGTGEQPLQVSMGTLEHGGQLKLSSVESMEMPITQDLDVLVIGGGSSGASAAIFSGREGLSTGLLEMNPGLGGTGTFGGVDSYWFGRRTGYANQITEAVHAMEARLDYRGPKWSIEAKKTALLKEAEAAGVDLQFQVLAFGTVMNGNQVKGVVYATRWGPRAAMAKIVIDASGDGDIAAFAGAEFIYGSEKDNTVMWYSLAQFKQNGKLQNNFTSMVDVSDIRDYTRAILSGRRRGDEMSDHGIYIATRESRHIVGDFTMKLTDQLLHRAWDDTINLHFSNHDVKGVSGADWINIGLIPPNLEIEVPYRMLLPQGIEGLLVVGKAISATHDAFPAIRMQSDLENLGGAAAQAAALAVKHGVQPRNIPLSELQQRLVKDGLIPESVLTRKLEPKQWNEDQLEKLAASIESDEPLIEYANMTMNEIYEEAIPFAEIGSIGPRIIPYLDRAMQAAEGLKKIHLAQALAMYGSKQATAVLIEAIQSELAGTEGLPVRTAKIMYVQLPPDHGAMPTAANLLYSLAETRDPRSIPIWEEIVRRFQPVEDDFKDQWQGLYYYVDAVCQGAERLGSSKTVPLLVQLHAHPLLHSLQRKDAVERDYFLERRAMLELALGGALARCGSAEGYAILMAYLDDGRSLLRKHAHKELRELSGQAFDMRPEAWEAWLEQAKPDLRPIPYKERLDIEENSEQILRRDT